MIVKNNCLFLLNDDILDIKNRDLKIDKIDINMFFSKRMSTSYDNNLSHIVGESIVVVYIDNNERLIKYLYGKNKEKLKKIEKY